MSNDDTREPLDRVRAADPAATDAPDLDAVRAAVDERLAVPDELAARRGHRARWVGAAAGVCALALAAGVGFAAGRSGGGAATVASDDVLPAFTLSAGSGGANAAGTSAGGAPALGAPEKAAAPADARMMPFYGARAVYTAADGLGPSAGTAPAYAFDARAVDGEAAVTRLAKALGVAGSATESGGVAMVGSTDGTGPTVSLSPDGLRSFSMYDPRVQIGGCVKAEPASGPSDSSGTAPSAPDAGCPASTAEPAPTGDAAIARAQDLMKAAGVDPSGYLWSTQDTGDPAIAYVTAEQVVQRQRTGLAWGFSLAHGGKAASANGFLAPVVPLGGYPTVSAVDAVHRLGDPAFGAGWYGGPMPMAADAKGGAAPAVGMAEGAPAATSSAGSAPVASGGAVAVSPTAPTLPVTPEPGSKLAWPVAHVTITKAVLGLAQQYQPDGAVLLVPTYQLSATDGGQWTMLALADSALDTSSRQ